MAACRQGPSDVAALITLGLNAVGRPSCTSGGAYLAELLAGQDVRVVGENDRKDDGSWPGRSGAQKIARDLATAWQRAVGYAMPPASAKDVRAWLNAKANGGLDLADPESTCRAGDELAALLAGREEQISPQDEQRGNGLVSLGDRDPETGRIVLSKTKTLPSAIAYVREFQTRTDGRTIHCFADVLFVWRDNRYVPVEGAGIGNALQPWLHNALMYVARPGVGLVLVPFDSNPATIRAALESVKLHTHLPESTPIPCWTGAPAGRADPSTILCCRSSNIHLPTGRVLAPSPLLFNTAALDFDFEPEAPPPALWLHFLGQLWPDDPESIEVLQEWMGYCLIADTSQHKMLILIGPRRSGKGTIGRILTRLAGAANVVGPTTSSLAGPFGLQPLIGKSLALVSDARFAGEGIVTVVERLLCISGEDTVTIDRKHLPSVTMKLPTRFMFLTNEVPRLTDASSALAGRFIVLRLIRSFYGDEDTGLTAKLIAELPGILRWAIEGWHRLRERGRFVQPQSAMDLVEDLEDLGSPVGAFVRERCVVAPGHRVDLDELYDAWRQWSQQDGRNITTTKMTFGKDLSAAVSGIKRRRGTDDRPFYEGIRLKGAPF